MKKNFVRVMLFGALTLAVTTTVTSCKDSDLLPAGDSVLRRESDSERETRRHYACIWRSDRFELR